MNVYEVRLIGSDDFEPTAQPINIPYGDWVILHEAEKPFAGYAYPINHIVLQIIWTPTGSQDERVHTLSYELTQDGLDVVFYTSDSWKIAVRNVKHAHDSGLQRLGWLKKLAGAVFIV